MTTWFTSDTHFFHKNVIKYCNRPFLTVEEMNETLIDNWNSCVGVDDTVFHLGDFAFCNYTSMAGIFNRLNGRIYLILGNHDNSTKKKYLEIGFKDVYQSTDLFEFHLNHYPTVGESCEIPDRFESKRPKCIDKWILCGHIHEKWKFNGNCFNVGVDVHGFKPISLEQVRKEIDNEQKKRLL